MMKTFEEALADLIDLYHETPADELIPAREIQLMALKEENDGNFQN